MLICTGSQGEPMSALSRMVYARGSIAGVGPFDDVSVLIEQGLSEAAAAGVTDPHDLEQNIRRTVGRWVAQTHRRRPMIVPVVVTV